MRPPRERIADVSRAIALLPLLLLPTLATAAVPANGAWRITRPEWTTEDEHGFGEFVRAIGQSRCKSFDECIHAPEIPGHLDPPAAAAKSPRFAADCADLPYLLRAFYGWRHGLPFAYTSSVRPAARGQGDLRSSALGNLAASRAELVTPANGAAPTIAPALRAIADSVSTATYRIGPSSPDFYPPRLDRQGIRPGTVIYDPEGHAAIVFDIDATGRVMYVDAHPDQSVTRRAYGPAFARSIAAVGAGFKNWRPQRLVGATPTRDGSLVGGRIEGVADAKLPGFSLEQFTLGDRLDWRGRAVDYYGYVRRSLAQGSFAYDPRVELSDKLDQVCSILWDRAEAVDEATAARTDRLAHPARLPPDIYEAGGAWETYATPGRDARLKLELAGLRAWLNEVIAAQATGRDREINYDGTDLRRDLAAIYRAKSGNCGLEYKNSDGRAIALSFDDVVRRLFDLSFDPYHCVERRWGESSAAGLATCREDSAKRAWYAGESYLRDRIDRETRLRTGFSLQELTAEQARRGDHRPDVDPARVLRLR